MRQWVIKRRGIRCFECEWWWDYEPWRIETYDWIEMRPIHHFCCCG